MTILSVVRDVCDRIGVVKPSAAFSSADLQIVQIISLAQQEGKELAKRHDWQVLTKEQTFSATAAEIQASAIPTDFDRFINDTVYNRTQTRKLEGPLTAQEWQYNRSVVATTIIQAFRQRGDDLLITPTPTAGDTIAFEYVAKNWCQSEALTAQSAWALDTDTGLLSEELMTLGTIWRWQKAKGLDYAESYRTYEMQVAQVAMREGAKPVLNMGSRSSNSARQPIIPDGNWLQ
jgi:hypothetical protein